MSKKQQNAFSKATGILAIILIVLGVYFALTETKEQKSDNKNPSNINIDKNNQENENEKINILGNYVVKDDKNSRLIIKENGEYELHINLCHGYLETSGTYETSNDKLRLLNEEIYEEYPTLYENKEFSFTIIDENTIRLDEDLVCLFQNTLFEK